MGVAVRQSYPPDKIAIEIKTPDGQRVRLAGDEPRVENVASDVEIASEMPGGYKSLQFALGRSPQIDWSDLAPYSEVKAYLPGGTSVFEGYLDQTPDITGILNRSVNPSIVGYQAILDDNEAAQIGIIDGDISKWGEPSVQRRANSITGGYPLVAEVAAGFQDKGSTPPGIMFDFRNVSNREGQNECGEQCYYGGVDIGEILAGFVNVGNVSSGNSSWDDILRLGKDDIISTYVNGTDLNATTTAVTTLKAPGSGYKYAFVISGWVLGSGSGQMTDVHLWTTPKVIGRHGMAYKGTWPKIGYTAKQILEYIILNFASPLTFDPNFIDDDEFVIPQAWYGDPGPPSAAVKDVVKYSLYDWFVYNKKRFEFRKPGTYGKFWKAYVAPSNLNEVGIDAQRVWSSVVVTYNDVDGTTRTVGPPGSGCNTESGLLEVNDPDHPAVRAGRTRRAVLDLRGIGTPETAIAVGIRFLEEAALLNRSGSATLGGYVMDQYGVFWPASMVKAGDWISFVDSSDKGYRKIVNVNYRHKDRNAEVDLDAPATGLEALLERLQVGLISLGVA